MGAEALPADCDVTDEEIGNDMGAACWLAFG